MSTLSQETQPLELRKTLLKDQINALKYEDGISEPDWQSQASAIQKLTEIEVLEMTLASMETAAVKDYSDALGYDPSYLITHPISGEPLNTTSKRLEFLREAGRARIDQLEEAGIPASEYGEYNIKDGKKSVKGSLLQIQSVQTGIMGKLIELIENPSIENPNLEDILVSDMLVSAVKILHPKAYNLPSPAPAP